MELEVNGMPEEIVSVSTLTWLLFRTHQIHSQRNKSDSHELQVVVIERINRSQRT